MSVALRENRVVERVAVVGCIGAGKSTLARTLGASLGLPVVHLDRRWWRDGDYLITGPKSVAAWTLPRDEYLQMQEAAAAEEQWIIDGGVEGIELRLARADTAIFLDPPLLLCAWRVIRRTGRKRDDYPPAVRESWRWALRLVRWVLWTYPRHRRPSIIRALARNRDHLDVIKLRRRDDVARFVAGIAER